MTLIHSVRKMTVVAIVVSTAVVGVTGAASAAPKSGKTFEHGNVVHIDHRGPGRGDDHRGKRHSDYRERFERHHMLGERGVRGVLRRQGYRHIRVMGRRGPVYIVKAHGWRGMRERLVVDGRSGDIVARRPIGGYGYHWGYR